MRLQPRLWRRGQLRLWRGGCGYAAALRLTADSLPVAGRRFLYLLNMVGASPPKFAQLHGELLVVALTAFLCRPLYFKVRRVALLRPFKPSFDPTMRARSERIICDLLPCAETRGSTAGLLLPGAQEALCAAAALLAHAGYA